MKIAFVLNALKTGGAEIHTIDLGHALISRGHRCYLVPLLAETELDYGGLQVAPACGNRLFNRRSQRSLAATLDQLCPDVVVAINGRPAACVHQARLWGGAPRIPMATIYHTTRLLDLNQIVQHALHLPSINSSDALVFVSQNQHEYCRRRLMRGRRTLTIHNGVDPARFSPAARALHRDATRVRLGLLPDDYVIGQSAAFRPEKNHAQSVEAVANLRAMGYRAHLLLLGDGPGRGAIEAKVQARNLGNSVIFAGRQQDVVPWLAAFDAGILTSTAIETFSLAALEVMSMGIPAVLSDIGGASEMVRPGENGYLFAVNDTPALTAALVGLADPAVRARMGDAAARQNADRFSRTTMIDRYEQLFEELANGC